MLHPPNQCKALKVSKEHGVFFFKLGFTPCKAEQPLRGIELQEKKSTKKITGYRKSV